MCTNFCSCDVTFDVVPQPGEAIIPYNYALAPRTIFTAFEVNREIKFGPRPDAPTPATTAKPGQPAPRPDPRYSLSFNLNAINALNSTNPGPPVGVPIPYFGKSISINSAFGLNSAANRILFLATSFRF